MQIVIATGVYPPDVGGPATYTKALRDAFVRAGHTVHICTFGNQKDERVSRVSRSGGALVRYMRFFSLLWKHRRADIIYAHDLFSVGLAAALVRRCSKKAKLVIRLGGDFLWEKAYNNGWTSKPLDAYYQQKPALKESLYRGVARFVLYSADHIIFSTQWQRSLYADVYAVSEARSSVIENGFPEKQKVEETEEGSLVFAGRLISLKRLDAVIEALAQTPELLLDIAGEGPLKEQLAALAARCGVSHRVTFLGYVHGQALDGLLAQARAVIIPSASDISPQLAHEAIARGVPLILTTYTGLRDSLQDVAWFVDPDDPSSVRDALQQVKNPQARREYAQRVQDLDTSRSWSVLAKEHLDIFEQMLCTSSV